MQHLLGGPGPGWVLLLLSYRRFERVDLSLALRIGTGYFFLRGAGYHRRSVFLQFSRELRTCCYLAQLVEGLGKRGLPLVHLRELRMEGCQLALHSCLPVPGTSALFHGRSISAGSGSRSCWASCAPEAAGGNSCDTVPVRVGGGTAGRHT